MEFSQLANKYHDELQDVLFWCNQEYESNFSKYFTEMETLYERMQSSSNPITDSELESILTDIPLQLFAASEALSTFKAGIEVIKLRIKLDKHDVLISSQATSQKSKQEEASYAVAEDETLLKVYNSVVERVERQISFSKELIMSAKKIWTARRETESVAVAADSTDLPDYTGFENKEYIR